MERFADSHDSFYITEVAEQANELAASIPQLLEKITLLQAAVNDFAKLNLEEGTIPEESFGYIPLDLGEFFAKIFALEQALTLDVDYRHPELRHRPCTFLEVGCGGGRLVHLLSCTDRFNFDKIHGFDISEPMIKAGQARYGLGSNLFVEDCLTFDYSGYDVVFFYRPLQDDDAETAFENRLIETLKPGAFIVGAGQESLDNNRKVVAKDDQNSIFKRL